MPLSHAGMPDHNHVHYLPITDTDTLASLHAQAGENLQAVILVNTENNHELERGYTPPESVPTNWPIPVILVTSSVGEQLMDIPRHKENIEVKVEARRPDEPRSKKSGTVMICGYYLCKVFI